MKTSTHFLYLPHRALYHAIYDNCVCTTTVNLPCYNYLLYHVLYYIMNSSYVHSLTHASTHSLIIDSTWHSSCHVPCLSAADESPMWTYWKCLTFVKELQHSGPAQGRGYHRSFCPLFCSLLEGKICVGKGYSLLYSLYILDTSCQHYGRWRAMAVNEALRAGKNSSAP